MSTTLIEGLRSELHVQPLVLDAIQPGNNDRKEFDQVELQQLADSIAAHGLAQPIIVRVAPRPAPNGRFEIVAGERRYRAHLLLREQGRLPDNRILAVIRNLDDKAAAAIMLIENLARVDLNAMEEAEAYQKHLDGGATVDSIRRMTGLSRKRIEDRLLLLNLIDQAKHLVKTGGLPAGHATQLARLDVNRQRIALKWFNGLGAIPTFLDFEAFCGKLEAEQIQDGLFDVDNFLRLQTLEAVSESRKNRYPSSEKLPEFRIRGRLDEEGDKYLAELRDSSDPAHRAAAEAISHIFHEFARKGWM